jgi:hypothetical protein
MQASTSSQETGREIRSQVLKGEKLVTGEEYLSWREERLLLAMLQALRHYVFNSPKHFPA